MLKRTGNAYIWQFDRYHSFLKNDHLLSLVSSIKIFNIVIDQDLRLEIASTYEIVIPITEFRWHIHMLKFLAGKFWLPFYEETGALELRPGWGPTASAIMSCFLWLRELWGISWKEYSLFRSLILGKTLYMTIFSLGITLSSCHTESWFCQLLTAFVKTKLISLNLLFLKRNVCIT